MHASGTFSSMGFTMLRYVTLSMLMAMGLVLLTVGLEAKKEKDDHDDPAEYRLRRNQLIITEVTPFCVDESGEDRLRIRGTHLGSLAPHVTLASWLSEVRPCRCRSLRMHQPRPRKEYNIHSSR